MVSIQLPHIHLKGPGTQSTINWSRQGCNTWEWEGKAEDKTRHPSSLLLFPSHAAFRTPLCRSSTGQSARLYPSSLLPYAPRPLLRGGNACVWYDASACVSVIMVCRANAPPPHPHPLPSPISPSLNQHPPPLTPRPQHKLVAYPQGRPN